MPDYSDLDPSLLKASISYGDRLKESITTELYTTGTPTAANQIQRSIMYEDGTLKESIATATGLKASWLLSGAAPVASTDFITEWSIVDNGTAAQRTITVPTTGTGYSYDIDWGDGTVETSQTTANPSHEYAAGTGTTTPTVKISGTFPRIYFNNGGDKTKITAVTNWGSVGTTSAARAFYGCSNLTTAPNGAWDVSDWGYGFHTCSSLTLPTALFQGNTSIANLDRCFMSSTFTELPALTFSGCTGVTNYQYLCYENTSLTTIYANQFSDSASATVFQYIYHGCDSLATVPSGHFSGTAGANFTYAFAYMASLSSLPQYLFPNTATAFNRTFVNCSNLVTLPSNLFGTASVTDYQYCFYNSGITTIPDAGNWDISAVTTMSNMFFGCTINTTDYNAMLVGWEAQTEPTGITFHGGSSKHSGAGTTARGVLTGTSTWVITDGGAV